MHLACVCYNNNGDVRLLVNHGIFISVAECDGYITHKGLDPELFKPYVLEVNELSLLNNLENHGKTNEEYRKIADAAIFDIVTRVLSNPLLDSQPIEYCIQRAVDRVVNYYPISYSLAESIVKKIVEGHYI